MLVDQGSSGVGFARSGLVIVVVVLASLLYGWLAISLQSSPLVIVLAVLPFAALYLVTKPLHLLYAVIGLALVADEQLTPWLRVNRGVGDLTGHALSWFVLSPLEVMLLAAPDRPVPSGP